MENKEFKSDIFTDDFVVNVRANSVNEVKDVVKEIKDVVKEIKEIRKEYGLYAKLTINVEPFGWD